MTTRLPERLRRSGRGRGLVYYGAFAIVCVAALALVVPFGRWPFRVPFHYGGDGLFFTVIVKAVAEDGPFHFERIGAPFGADIVDWPLGMWLPLGITSLLTWTLGHAGSAINAYWLLSIVVTGLASTWALRRLALPPAISFVLGLLFAFLPFTFYRNVDHVNVTYPFVPLLALLALRVAGAGSDRLDGRERAFLLVVCVAQGLSFIYYTFFACVLLLAAIPLGWLRTRRLDLVRLGGLGVLLLTLSTAVPLVPSFVYWHRHGRNESLAYKSTAEADELGLKLRQLLTPNPDHPVPAFRAIAERIRAAGFRDENENASARLGLVGSLGLLALLAFALGRTSGALPADDALGPATALTLVALLFAQVGGLGSVFNVFVSPDIRAYNRISVFIGFFALFGAGVLLARLAAHRLVSGRLGRAAVAVGLVAVGALGIADQVPRSYLVAIRAERADAFAEDESFVALVESRLPAGAMVFQLPHATIPVDRASRPPMGIYDPGGAYLSSRSLRWSWGSILGRTDEWQTAVAALPPAQMIDRLVQAGFLGLWVDRRGYAGERGRGWTELEEQLAQLTTSRPEVSTAGRYAFFSLVGRAERWRAQVGPGELAAAREQALGPVVAVRWRDGCPDDGRGEGQQPASGRSCGGSASAIVRNFARRMLRVTIVGTFDAERPGRLTVSGDGAADAFSDQLELGKAPISYRREVRILADRKLRLAFSFDGPCPPTTPSRCWRITDLRASDPRYPPAD